MKMCKLWITKLKGYLKLIIHKGLIKNFHRLLLLCQKLEGKVFD